MANLEGQGPLYAVGGHDGWSYLNSVERWDPATRQWSFVAPMNSQRSTVGVAALNGKYVDNPPTFSMLNIIFSIFIHID